MKVVPAPKRYKVKWLNIALLFISVYCFYLVTDRYLELMSLHQQADITRSRLENAEKINQELQAERDRLQTPSYVEKLAREQLGLVKPGEVPYVPAGKR